MDNQRRSFLGQSAALVGGLALAEHSLTAKDADKIEVLDPRMRVPMSFIIDDSTCLVNMGHFCLPQFATAWPKRKVYQRNWKTWSREIPDAFVREFGEWCAQHDVKGKYSVVPYPCCVGWLDRVLPGWSRRELQDSIKLVRNLLLPNWDIHPEMITHTRVIDLKTGRPMEKISAATMENSYPRVKKSVDELTAYLAYALKILRNVGLPCEGITTPGGFGNLVKSELSLAVQEAVRDVFKAELPHYFKYVSLGKENTEPKLEHVKGVGTNDLRLTVNVPAGTGDWFGGWTGVRRSEGHRYCNADASQGRMVELIKAKKPAVMLCHWPGMYCNGRKTGFHDFQKVVTTLHGRFKDETIWMKVSEIARYWAARKLTKIRRQAATIEFDAPLASNLFTIRCPSPTLPKSLTLHIGKKQKPLKQVEKAHQLKPNTWLRQGDAFVLCMNLPKGKSSVRISG